MKFPIDRCAGRRLAEWLHEAGHDVFEARLLGEDPGDRQRLRIAAEQDRILVTIDKDFGQLIHLHETAHCGLVRLPDVAARRRIAFMADLLEHHSKDLLRGAVITIRGARIRISQPAD